VVDADDLPDLGATSQYAIGVARKCNRLDLGENVASKRILQGSRYSGLHLDYLQGVKVGEGFDGTNTRWEDCSQRILRERLMLILLGGSDFSRQKTFVLIFSEVQNTPNKRGDLWVVANQKALPNQVLPENLIPGPRFAARHIWARLKALPKEREKYISPELACLGK